MDAPKTPPEILQLGPFQLLVGNKVLLSDWQQVPLAPRAVEVLVVLATQANQIVSKDDLMRAVWPDTFVEEVNLAVHISALRKLLAGAGGAIRIETIPKRGYRLRGDVRAAQPEPPAESAGADVGAIGQVPTGSADQPRPAPVNQHDHEASSPGLTATHPMRPRTLAGLTLAVVLLVLAGVWLDHWANRAQGRVEAGGARIDSLAVLPLDNLSGDPKQDYFAAGITDDLTTELAHIRGLKVVSRTSASQFQSAHRSLPEIARALGVQAVIEGSVVRDGNRVRITTQLIDATTDRHLWAGSYEDSIDEIIALQDRAARDVAREIRAAVKPEDALLPSAPNARPSGVDRQAYDDYLEGLYVWNRRDVRTFDRAIEYFSRAATEDPHFAPAFASLADVYVLWGMNGKPTTESGPLARRAALNALAQDPNSAEAHTALAATSAVFEWNWAAAAEEFQRAIELDPNYATGHQWYADFYLVPELKLDEAQKEIGAAVALDPLSPIMLVDDGWIRYLRGDYPRAWQQFQRALAMDPNFVPAHFRIEGWYLAQHRDAEYAQAAEKNARVASADETLARAVETGFAREGMRGLARAELNDAVRRGEKPDGAVAAVYWAMLGDTGRTCAALRNRIHDHDTGLLYVNVDARYAGLRKLSCYADVARQIGLPQLPATSAASRPLQPARH
ncbi:MAG TPA: winged helix-turn-helix domain-containing protein [Terriglobia bacterium]|nr:winged helix-turn-helix domain-containing protein [Terriglobia bacterium]